jgi:N-acetylglucosamine-6-phosphate deacetylase
MNIVVSLGHTAATFEEGKAGLASGATLITHLYNAMPSFHHRSPGIVGLLGSTLTPSSSSSSSEEEISFFYSVIADGIHCHPAAVSLAYNSHSQGCVLITDGMSALGCGDGEFALGDMNVTVKNGEARLKDVGNTLAGAVCSLDQCVRNFVKFTGCSIAEAVDCVTRNPAKVLKMEDTIGSLEDGMRGDFVLLDPITYEVKATFISGERVFSSF